MEEVTTELIVSTLQKWVKEKRPVSPMQWLDAGLKLNVLIGDEQTKLWDLKMKVSSEQFKVTEEKEWTSAKAKAYSESTQDYHDMKIQEARIKQIEEMIRLAKKFAQLKADEAKGGY